jgi:tousled-like kinase
MSTDEEQQNQEQQQQQQRDEQKELDVAALQSERSRLQTQVRQLQERLSNEVHEREFAICTLEDTRNECAAARAQLEKLETKAHDRRIHVANVLQTMLRDADKREALMDRQQNVEAGFRLGRIVVHKHGVGPRMKVQEVWEDGQLMRNLRQRQGLILQQREELENRKKHLSKLSRKRSRAAAAAAAKNTTDDTIAAGNSNSQGGGADEDGLSPGDDFDMLELIEAEETVRVQMLNIKKEELAMVDEKHRLAAEKVKHVRSLKRIRDEDNSRFNLHPTLNNRYLLRSMLGKGGFSEVWKAFDLHELRDVAVKIHELNPMWNENKKASYLRHATREYRIHLALVHPRIVQLYDVFEIDSNSFATVLEYCEGHDLDLHLKQHKASPQSFIHSFIHSLLSFLLLITC